MPPRLTLLLLSLYPRALRAAYADDLAAALDARAATARRSPVALAGFLARTIADAFRARRTTRAEARWLRAHRGIARARAGADAWTDLRLTGRAFARVPGFFAGVILTLALGIGANTVVFSLVKAVVLQPLPYDRPGDLVMVWMSFDRPDPVLGYLRGNATPRYLLGWRDQAAGVMTVAGVESYGSLDAQMDLETADGAERLNGAFATSNFFELMGIRARIGRVFTPVDEAAGADDAIVLGHGLWQRAFGGDPSIVGRPVTLVTGSSRRRGPRTFRVIGVLDPAVRFNYPEEVEVWAMEPWSRVARRQPDGITYQVVGRLNPGVSFEVASERMAALHNRIQVLPERPGGQRQTTRLERMHDWVVGETPPAMSLLSAVALLLLVITCATVANALFIRLSERGRELALRTALGASRGRLLRQLLLEGAAIAAAGTAAGLVVATAALPALRALVPASVPRGDEIGLDAAVLVFAAASVLVVTLLTSLAPAWRGARVDLAGALRRSAGSVSSDRSTSRLRRALVGLQAGVATALLVAAALLLASFWHIVRVPVGFEADGVVTAEIRVLDPAYREDDRLRALQDALRDRVAAIPGVARVGITSAVPFRGVDWFRGYFFEHLDREVSGNRRHVSPEYFDIMNVELRAGRLLTEADAASTPPVAVVSEGYAREAFGSGSPLGRQLGQGGPTIVGVVSDLRYTSYTRDPMRAIYLPVAQTPTELMCLLVEPHAGQVIPADVIRRAVREVDPALPAMKLSTVDAILAESLADRRFYMLTTAMFAGLALLITLVGLVVIVARTIVERRKEMAIRAALGATGARLQIQAARSGLLPVAVGVGIGLVAAFAAAGVLSSFLFGIAPRAVEVYAGVAVVLMTVSVLAGWLAGRRAAASEPALALRAE